jgi:hypothetical protein
MIDWNLQKEFEKMKTEEDVKMYLNSEDNE